MKNYAKVENGVVVETIYIDEKKYDSLPEKEKWLETSFNVNQGIYFTDNGYPHENQDLVNETIGRKRKNYAFVGYTYDEKLDAFIPPKPYPNWVFDEKACVYYPPKNEQVKDWQKMEYKYNPETNTGKFV